MSWDDPQSPIVEMINLGAVDFRKAHRVVADSLIMPAWTSPDGMSDAEFRASIGGQHVYRLGFRSVEWVEDGRLVRVISLEDGTDE